ncbi:MAG: precorrin-6y C5,15-methyltransferase (decarboxylating) subunit CbiE [Nitrospirota bacterium]
MAKICVIGIGYKPLGKKARNIIYDSEVILASSRLFEVFKGYEEFELVKDKIEVIDNVDKTIEFMKSQINGRLITVLASGDPMFVGIGRRIINEFGKDLIEIFPDLSSMQIAFARIKESWDDAFLMSLHGRRDITKRKPEYELNDIPVLLRSHGKIGILTDTENNPAAIAKILHSSPVTDKAPTMYVCQKLGYPDERITTGTPAEIISESFLEPNVVIILSS